jgi:hypothetical protein
MQIIDVLRDEQHVRPFAFKPDQGVMSRVWFNLQQSLTAKGVEAPDGLRISPPCGRCGHLIDAMPFP